MILKKGNAAVVDNANKNAKAGVGKKPSTHVSKGVPKTRKSTVRSSPQPAKKPAKASAVMDVEIPCRSAEKRAEEHRKKTPSVIIVPTNASVLSASPVATASISIPKIRTSASPVTTASSAKATIAKMTVAEMEDLVAVSLKTAAEGTSESEYEALPRPNEKEELEKEDLYDELDSSFTTRDADSAEVETSGSTSTLESYLTKESMLANNPSGGRSI